MATGLAMRAGSPRAETGVPGYPDRASIDWDRPPTELTDLVNWYERISYGLVISEPYPLDRVRAAADRFETAVREHAERTALPPVRGPTDRLGLVLRADHRWFSQSFEQLRWFLGVVAREDHGGNRQALGQFGRLVTESVRRHLADEREYVEGPTANP